MTGAGADIFPAPETGAGWSHLTTPAAVAKQAGMDRAALDQLFELQEFLFGGQNWSSVIVRGGRIVYEHASFMGLATSRFDIWSCTKSVTAMAWGMLLEDSRNGRLAGGQRIDLDTPAYAMLPAGQRLSDPLKAQITIGHLLSMTSGIKGEDHGLYGVPAGPGIGPYEHALGYEDNRYGRSAATLAATPGTTWEYSDPAYAHLTLLFAHLAGIEMADYVQQRLFDPIGITQASFTQLGGAGAIGPHTCGHVGLVISARDLARLGLLASRGGAWDGQQIIPRWWGDMATRTSQDLNPEYGLGWWVNTRQTRWPNLPADAFAMQGHNTNVCYVIPSLDLVAVKVGSGPTRWNEGDFINGVVAAITN